MTTFLILSLTVFFNIEDIEILGKTTYKKEEILKISGIKKGDNLILTNNIKAEKEIFNFFKKLDHVVVKKHFPNKITIICYNSIASFFYQQQNKNYTIVSKNNRIIETNVKEKPKGLFLLCLSRSNTNNYKIGDFLNLEESEAEKFDIIKNSINYEKINNITAIAITNTKILITFENRVVLEIEDIEDISYLINISSKILKTIIGPLEHGKIIYLKSKKSIHFIPKNKI